MTDLNDYPISFETNYAAATPSDEVIDSLRAEVKLLTSQNESQRSQITFLRNEQSEFEDRLKEAVENDEIDSDLAKEFADIFSMELSKEYSITITASWSGTVTVPFGYSIDDLDISCNYPEVSYSCDDFEMDVNEDEIDWDTQEAY